MKEKKCKNCINFIPIKTGKRSLTRCIGLGNKTGYDWRNEDLRFGFVENGQDGDFIEYSTYMTEEEYKVIFAVVKRALKNKRIIKVSDIINSIRGNGNNSKI